MGVHDRTYVLFRTMSGEWESCPAQHGIWYVNMVGMIPNITRGSSPSRLLAYLFGKGRHNEHRDQHVIACSANTFDMLDSRFDVDGKPLETFHDIGERFDRSYRKLEKDGQPYPPDMRGAKNIEKEHGKERIWHCSLAINARDGILTDRQWEQVAKDYLRRMGLVDEHGGDLAPWVAVRHGLSQNGNDHIHLMVSLAGYEHWMNPYHDRIHAQKTCRQMEKERPELRELANNPTRSKTSYEYRQWRKWAEWKARQDYGTGYDQLDADTRTQLINKVALDTLPREHIGRLVAACAADSHSEDEFIRRVRRCGLNIDPRLKKGTSRETFDSTDQVTGYTVTWRSSDGWRERISGYALGKDMTLKELRRAWHDDGDDELLAVREWQAVMEHHAPVLHHGWERQQLTMMDMNRLIDEAFHVVTNLGQASGEDEYHDALREGLRTFERLALDYELQESSLDARPMDTMMPGVADHTIVDTGHQGAVR